MLLFFPLDVFDEIWDVIGSVSEGYLTYSYTVIWVEYQYIYSDESEHVPYGIKLLKSNENKITKHVYQMLRQDANTNIS